MAFFSNIGAGNAAGSLVGSCVALAAAVVASVGPAGTSPARAADVAAVPTNDFLNSIGIVTTFPDRGQPLDKTTEMIDHCGFRWVRAGIEGVRENGPTTMDTFLALHKATGVKLNWGLVSGGSDIKKLIAGGRVLAEAGALLAFEGNNEPNNWGVTYKGEKGGGREGNSWMPIAKLHRDLYAAVKADPLLSKYPVWSLSENGGQTDNVGLQFLTIPQGAGTLMPDGTPYADFANCHNYVYHPRSRDPIDNRTWNAADPSPACLVDGLYGNYGQTWLRKFNGYSQAELNTLPRVTTETGCAIEGPITEELHGLHLMNLYLAQFKRGWSYTSVYLLRDRTDEEGNQKYGFFRPDYSPRPAATYLHNLTSILNEDPKAPAATAGSLDYAIANQPDTVHDLLLRHSDGTYQLIVWGERLTGEDRVTVRFGATHPTVTIYDPTVGTEAVKKAEKVNAIELTLTDHPLVLSIPAAR